MTCHDIMNESSDVDVPSKTKASKNEEEEEEKKKRKKIDSIIQKNECDANYEQKEKRERSLSSESYRPEKKKLCCCHENNVSKCSNKTEKGNTTPKNKNADTLTSTGINEFAINSKNINEPFKFFIGGIPQNITNKVMKEDIILV
ncbi:RNA-binding protein, putative [Plasmodium malariae]|uniref:RNA-binding protein, putative n=1 Tax=Plasmodium malariae TaxID=5858 RepID=A0A1A8XAM8_PLAMA|nr:RNA-binding protein, putative [Plasmodium malariae]